MHIKTHNISSQVHFAESNSSAHLKRKRYTMKHVNRKPDDKAFNVKIEDWIHGVLEVQANTVNPAKF